MIAIVSLTMVSFITWFCLLWGSRKMLNSTSQNKSDSISPKLMDLFNIMEIVLGTDKASLKNVIKAETSNCMQLKTVLHMFNIIGNFQHTYGKIFLGALLDWVQQVPGTKECNCVPSFWNQMCVQQAL